MTKIIGISLLCISFLFLIIAVFLPPDSAERQLFGMLAMSLVLLACGVLSLGKFTTDSLIKARNELWGRKTKINSTTRASNALGGVFLIFLALFSSYEVIATLYWQVPLNQTLLFKIFYLIYPVNQNSPNMFSRNIELSIGLVSIIWGIITLIPSSRIWAIKSINGLQGSAPKVTSITILRYMVGGIISFSFGSFIFYSNLVAGQQALLK